MADLYAPQGVDLGGMDPPQKVEWHSMKSGLSTKMKNWEGTFENLTTFEMCYINIINVNVKWSPSDEHKSQCQLVHAWDTLVRTAGCHNPQCEPSPLCYGAPFPGVCSTMHPLSRPPRPSTDLLKAVGVKEILPTWPEVWRPSPCEGNSGTPAEGHRWSPGHSHHLQSVPATGLSPSMPGLVAGWLYKQQLQSTHQTSSVSTARLLLPRHGILLTSSHDHWCHGVPWPRSTEEWEDAPQLRFLEQWREMLSSWEGCDWRRRTTHLHQGLMSIWKPYRPWYHASCHRHWWSGCLGQP